MNTKKTLHRVEVNGKMLVDVVEAAAMTGLTEAYIRMLARDAAKLRSYKINGRWWFEESQVQLLGPKNFEKVFELKQRNLVADV